MDPRARPATSLEAPRGAATAPLPHQQAEIEATGVDQQAFEDVVVPAQVGATHPARVIDMRKRAFEVLAASAQQPLATRPAHAPMIAVDGPFGVRSGRPPAAAAVRLGHGTEPRWRATRSTSDCCG